MGIGEYIRRLFKSNKQESTILVNSGFDIPHRGFLALHTQSRIPGLAITAFHNERKIFEAGYGFSNIDMGIPINPSKSIFRVASASKPIAATALLHMVKAGDIELDRSFYDYVPYFPKKQYDFTIRQLASHTAGIRSYRGKEFALNEAWSIKESIVFFQDDPLLFKPGTSYHYNSLDWVLISLAMEEVSGIPFAEYVKQNVLIPLGMERTFPENPEDQKEGEVTKYTRWKVGFRSATPVDNRYKLAGGGFLTTAGDLCKLGLSYLNGRIPDDSVRREFLSPQLINGESTYYGLGWEVSSDLQGRSFYGHTGNSVGGYSNFRVYPDHKVVIATLINSTDPGVQNDLDLIYDQFFTNL